MGLARLLFAQQQRKRQDKITTIPTSGPITTPAMKPDLLFPPVFELPPGVGRALAVRVAEGLAVVGLGKFVNSAEAASDIIDSAASTTLEQMGSKSDVYGYNNYVS